MPCKKCKDGKYKWGNTGECKYATKDECEKANPKKYNKMNPTPLGKKTYEEYAKELKEFNLSAEPKLTKVELGLVDDFTKKLEFLKDFDKFYSKRIAKLRTDYLEARGIAINVKDMYSDAESDTKEAKEIISEIRKIFSQMEKAVKELGLNINEIKGAKDYNKIIANIEDDIDSYTQQENDYKALVKII
jgi:hypothetical protein